jgi:hypothetical protein
MGCFNDGSRRVHISLMGSGEDLHLPQERDLYPLSAPVIGLGHGDKHSSCFLCFWVGNYSHTAAFHA